MPTLFLSPSTQESNFYVTGGSEEYHMNLLADAMVPYLISCGIRYRRNTPDMTAASSIRMGNAGEYDFYLALHSNASGAEYGSARGIIAFYDPRSENGRRAADLFAANLRTIYPLPEQVRVQATVSLGEVTQPRFPSVLLEIGYHDNYADATWITNNTVVIAQNLVLSLTEYFGIPFIWPMDPLEGTVSVSFGTLALRARPSTDAAPLAAMPQGAQVRIFGSWQGWYVVHYGDLIGYAAADYIAT